MPFFQSFQEFKGLTSSFLFASEPPASTTTSTTVTPNGTPKAIPASAVAGPGPSTTANARASLAVRQHSELSLNSSSTSTSTSTPTTPSNERLNPLGRPIPTRQASSTSGTPIRPSLKHSNTGNSTPSSSDSSDNVNGKRRVSGTNVSIADPEVSGVEGERRKSPRRKNSSRPPSPASGLSGIDREPRIRKKKTPLDTYIIVKPPPTSNKNPLNLQIQLVVKPTRPRRDRSASGISSRSGSIVGDGIVASPISQIVDLPTEESDDTSSKEGVITSEAPLSTSSSNDKGLPGSPKSSSTGSENGNNGAGLRRSSSIRSSISTSTAATGSSSASGKRIEPMFNLAVHNVMQPTVVTDASTDVKVAKFHKRNLDITGVGILEPSEVWLPASQPANAFPSTLRQSTDGGPRPTRQRPVSLISLTSPISPTLSRSDDGKGGIRGSIDLKGFKMENLRLGQNKADGQESKTKQFFGKVFKRKTSMNDINSGKKKTSPSASFSSTFESTQTATSPSHDFAGVNSLHPNMAAIPRNHSVTAADLPTTGVGAPTFGTAPLVIRRRSSGAMITPDGAVTGLTAHSAQPVETATKMERCQSLPIIPSNRPVGYTWTVKKWAKKNEDGWAAHLRAAANAGLEIVGGNAATEGEDDVVFEWVKLRVPSNATGDDIMRRYSTNGAISGTRARTKSRSGSVPPELSNDTININSPNRSRTDLGLQPPNKREASPLPRPSSPNLNSIHSNQASPMGSPRLDGRPEPVRRISASVSPSRRTSSTSVSSNTPTTDNMPIPTSTYHGETTADEDSDPEDSETPWTCSVWVKKTGQRQLLGTLTPAPHHPKVIGILKIPQGLDSVSLTNLQPKSDSNTQVKDLHGTIKKIKDNIALTEENLKDVVCVTAMWLVAREEFNGLGKKKNGRRGTQG
ncbi:uncharacterized protein L201_002065 [Kwoniella dendrophila CBS 6074]|uniref:Uncharacterized protein n=1 Tax=Kwoniella dendrophila CBS 6074 TaxID=1295534 RepID=A0AAX4JPA0_9TREE